jgi:hypothetical protein
MAFFGVDRRFCERVQQHFQHHEVLRVAPPRQESHPAHALFRQIRAEDVVFIKAFTPQTGLSVFAIGTALPGGIREYGADSYLPVHWAWRGEHHLLDPDDTWSFRGDPVYEEFNLAVQRELIDLMPDKVHDPFFVALERVSAGLAGMPPPQYQAHVEVLPHFVAPNT